MQKFVRVKNKHTQNQTQLGKEPTIITEKIHQEQENISNKINITQIDQGRKSVAQDTIYIYIYIYIYMNTKVRCKSRNMTNFNQKDKILKTLNFHYDTET